jgi:hypothetical protein
VERVWFGLGVQPHAHPLVDLRPRAVEITANQTRDVSKTSLDLTSESAQNGVRCLAIPTTGLVDVRSVPPDVAGNPSAGSRKGRSGAGAGAAQPARNRSAPNPAARPARLRRAPLRCNLPFSAITARAHPPNCTLLG